MSPISITYKVARRLAVIIVGSTVLLLGVVMIVTPGPAVVFIPVGLAILGIEFAWARSWLKRLRKTISANGSERRAEQAEKHRQQHME
jgi:tellurite resistance protein TerC